ncbi:MAG TPA: tRNA (N(6)-L-threonylcarbamoyladenosine(37)-C(2))-methylthiotransferase MtaB [Desulfitobacteriaceae bacterium]|nr:tRNA (N(6)-L-threonylcarbamoyladenosine(37)-C(2))-methylthiotransferase MtaB [Desulfitobacteriaceae bacterium]
MTVEKNKIIDGQEQPKVCFVTLGCKVNQAESEALAQLFRNAGYQIVDPEQRVAAVVINTCTVTNTGSSKSRQAIRRLVRSHPESHIIVSGCYAQTASEEILAIPGVDLVIGTQYRTQILKLLEHVKKTGKPCNAVQNIGDVRVFEELPQLEEESRTRAMLKIEDGCNRFCTYCIIPYARGPVRSRLPENALAEAERLIRAGYQEIVLTGIHVGAYGEDLAAGWNLARLLQLMLKIPGMHRLHLGSVEPLEFSQELIAVIAASEVICPHLHIPLQSGSNAVLARMQRPYNIEDYRDLLKKLFQSIPHLAVTTDIIAGFPGESETSHSQTIDFVGSCGFAGIHVFPYSRREGTVAAAYPDQVSDQVKARRVKELLQVSRGSQEKYSHSMLGHILEVLVERVDTRGWAYGHTENYLPVNLPPAVDGDPWQAGQLVSFILEKKHLAGRL